MREKQNYLRAVLFEDPLVMKQQLLRVLVCHRRSDCTSGEISLDVSTIALCSSSGDIVWTVSGTLYFFIMPCALVKGFMFFKLDWYGPYFFDQIFKIKYWHFLRLKNSETYGLSLMEPHRSNTYNSSLISSCRALPLGVASNKSLKRNRGARGWKIIIGRHFSCLFCHTRYAENVWNLMWH